MAEAVTILLVGGAPDERRRVESAFGRAGWRVKTVGPGGECLVAALGRGGDLVVLLDPDPAGTSGGELLARVAETYPETPVVVVSGRGDVAAATDAMRRGAWDYVVGRAAGGHLVELQRIAARALERRWLVRERNRYREETEALALALRETADGVVIVGVGGRVSFVNRALAEAWSQPEPAILGRFLGDFVRAPDGAGSLADALAAAVETGRWSGDLESRGLEPPRGPWEVTLTPIRCREGDEAPATGARRLIGIFRDASAKRALEELRADFLSMVTHDIKVPLTVILGYTEMLTDPEPPPDEIPPDVLARIRESGETINALVCNFLDLSRIEAGRMTIDPRRVDPCTMLAHAVEHYESSARHKGLRLEFEAAPVPVVMADEPHLQRVLANLIGNAIKYTPRGGRITVSTGVEGGRVALRFRDTGRGIPPDELPHLFEKYRRVPEAKRTEGTGLGLFIAKTIVSAHGGDIRVESTVGQGSTFTVLLPAGVPRQEPAQMASA